MAWSARLNHQFSLFNAATDGLTQVGANGGPSTLYPKDWKNFAPRVSLVDDLLGNGKLVVRTGVGVFYDGPSQDFFVGNQPWNTLPAQAGPAFNNIGFATSVAPSHSHRRLGDFRRLQRYQCVHCVAEAGYSAVLCLQLKPGIAGSQADCGGDWIRGFARTSPLPLHRPQPGEQQSEITYTCSNGTSIAPGSSCYPNFVYINQVETSALSNYNSMQATLKIQNWHGVTSTLNYTWAHSIDTASDGLDFVPNAAQPDNSFNPHAERANSNFDVRNRVQWYWNYALPNYKTAKWLTNGWSLDGMFNFATGQPYTVSYLYEDDYNGSGEWFGRPDIISNPQVSHTINASGINLLNAAAFAAPCTWNTNLPDPITGLPTGVSGCVPGTQHPGSEGRNAFRSTSYTNFDFTLAEDIAPDREGHDEASGRYFQHFQPRELQQPAYAELLRRCIWRCHQH